ncbi:MAG: hypothetical protein HFJ09_08845 [Lachnospiraceae bacterium]|nr:hypothetical protein [Lachnospiraceae bacterium]
MANEIKAEFETYVQQLAETICKEIYLEDLKALCNTYTEQLEGCKNLYKEHIEGNKELQNQNGENLEKLTSVNKMLEENLQAIQAKMVSFENEYENILKEYSTKVFEINDEMREAFLSKFLDVIEVSKDGLTKELDLYHKNISKSLEAALTEEGIQKFIVQMEASTAKISESLEFIQGGYQEVFEQYSAKVGAYGDKEQERFRNIVENTTREGMKYFKECIDRAVEEQKHMLEDRMASSDVQKLEKDIAIMSKDMKEMQKSYENKLSLMIKILEKDEKVKLRLEKESKIEKKYLFCLVVVNIVLLFFTGITLLSAEPWTVLGIVPTTIALVLLICIVLYMVFFRSKKALSTSAKKISKENNKE